MQSYSGEGFYERLGVRPVINAWSWVTVAGGSIMPTPVVRAMEEASRNFVDLHDLNRKAGEVIARLTGAEAGLVSAGSGAGMLLQAAACMTGTDPAKVWRLPDTRGMKNRIVMHRSHRVSYDRNFRTAGAKLVEIGDMGVTEPWQLEDAITRRTAAVAYVFGPRKSGALSLETVVEIAHSRGVPVIVDAAAMLPPAENLTKFIRMGFDLVTFSGGKAMRGPQSTGLLLGRKDLIAAARRNGLPHANTIGRGMKVNKEEMLAMMVAVETYFQLDHENDWQGWERQVETIAKRVEKIRGVRAERFVPPIANRSPQLHIGWDRSRVRIHRDQVIEQLRDGEPAIEARPWEKEELEILVWTLQPGEAKIVGRRIGEILKAAV
jgi:L-seryl-tRNA(Ser) seleniumtransferase